MLNRHCVLNVSDGQEKLFSDLALVVKVRITGFECAVELLFDKTDKGKIA